VTKLFGGLLMAFGIIIATLTGLCSAYWLVFFLSAGFNRDLLFGLALVAAIGLLPCAGGVGLFFWGRSLLRAARARGE
jgi:hypothetical protein